MKKIVPILLAVALALALCLVGFADAERYDDDPLEETAVPTSEAVLEEAEPVPARSSECAECGEMRVYIQKIGEYEAGPWEKRASIRPQEPMRYTITIASIRKSAVAAATNPLHGMFAAARQAESATVGKLFPGAADGLKNL